MFSQKTMIGLGVLLSIITILSIFASAHPDGLEFVAEEEGFLDKAEEIWEGSPFPDYEIGDLGGIGTILSAAIGMIFVAGIFFVPAVLISKRSEKSTTTTTETTKW
ncbi:MAG: PDGLE domain-containing protein [Promethearchaeota archaeon]